MAGKTHETHEIRAQDKTSGAFRSAGRSVQQFNTRLSRLATVARRVTIAALAARAGAEGIGAASAKSADAIVNYSRQVGASVEFLSEMQLALRKANINQEQFITSIQRAQRRASEAATGNKQLAAAFDELGVNATEFTNLRPEEQINRLADALSDVPNQADRVRLAFKILDSEGVRLLRIFQDGREGIAQFRDEAIRTGNTLTGSSARQLSDYAGSIEELKESFAGLGRQIALFVSSSPFIQWVTDAVQAITNLIRRLRLFAGEVTGQTLPDLRDRAQELSAQFDETYQNVQRIERSLESIRRSLINQKGEFGDISGFATITERALFSQRGLLEEEKNKLAEIVEEHKKITEEIRRRQEAINEGLDDATARASTAGGQGLGTGQTPKKEEDRLRKVLETRQRLRQEALEQEQAFAIQELELQKAATDARIADEKRLASTMKSLRANATSNAISLLQTLGSKSKAFAIAAIFLEKARAIAQTIISTQEAVMKSLAINPYDYANVARIKALGAASVGLIAAQGLFQATQVGGGGAGAGSPGGEPVRVEPVAAAPAAAPTQIVINIDDDQVMSGASVRNLIERINEEVSNGVVLAS